MKMFSLLHISHKELGKTSGKVEHINNLGPKKHSSFGRERFHWNQIEQRPFVATTTFAISVFLPITRV